MASKSKFKDIEKEDFIEILKSMSVEDINKLISEKGKKPKLINPVIFVKDIKK